VKIFSYAQSAFPDIRRETSFFPELAALAFSQLPIYCYHLVSLNTSQRYLNHILSNNIQFKPADHKVFFVITLPYASTGIPIPATRKKKKKEKGQYIERE
jgi:hypothetical protein